jgi:hypothetical protein
MTNQSSIQEVLFFPQMRPEAQASGEAAHSWAPNQQQLKVN